MASRLTPQQRADRALTGAQLQKQVTDLAEILGWRWVHFRPAQTKQGWRTPVEGPLGKGWPDLVLFRPGRTLYVEIKRELGDPPTDDQLWVHERIREGGNECEVWKPSDWPRIETVLR